ncbi:hypothetical protein EON65_00420, partial [archaeon]
MQIIIITIPISIIIFILIILVLLLSFFCSENTEVLPDSPISWTHIWELLDRERIPLDYQRRYKTLLYLNHRYMYVPHIHPQNGVLGGVGGV